MRFHIQALGFAVSRFLPPTRGSRQKENCNRTYQRQPLD
jgi:hypothetical protein